MAVADGSIAASVRSLLDEFESHGADRPAAAEVTRDISRAYPSALASELPGATQRADRLHVMRMLDKPVDRVRRAEARS